MVSPSNIVHTAASESVNMLSLLRDSDPRRESPALADSTDRAGRQPRAPGKPPRIRGEIDKTPAGMADEGLVNKNPQASSPGRYEARLAGCRRAQKRDGEGSQVNIL